MAIQPKAPSQQQPKQGQQTGTQQPAQQSGQSWKQGQAGQQNNLGQQHQKGSLGQAQKGQVNQNDMENQADI